MLAVSLITQSFASAGQGLVTHLGEGLEHALLHASKDAHHHHDDGSFHEDESDESNRHLQADSALNAVALLSPAAGMLIAANPGDVLSSASQEAPPPILDGPRRPPRPAR